MRVAFEKLARKTIDIFLKFNIKKIVKRWDKQSRPKRRKLSAPEFDKDRVVRVYADGIFDLFHFGHMKALEQCKKVFPNVYLLVGVCDDELTRKMKGKTVMNHKERAESIRHCKWVDEVIEHAPWVVTQEFLDKHRIDCVAHDAEPYTEGSATDVYAFVKEKGMFAPTQRTEGISTSDIITRVVKDYDQFVRRNLERGYSRHDMNVGYLKEKRIKLRGELDEMKSNIIQKGDEVIDSSKELVGKWVENSQKFIDEFLQLFGRQGTLNRYVKEKVNTFTDDFKKFAKQSPM
eukprot:131451_1